MRFVAYVTLAACCTAFAGCSFFSKRSANPVGPPSAERGARPPVDPIGAGIPPQAPAAAPTSGVLAGQVVAESYDRRPPATFIQVVEIAGTKTEGAPIEVSADSQGYFTIHGLQPGRRYQLTARAKDGNQVLAGTVMAIPPNPKLLIRISENLATSSTPPIPPKTTLPDSAPKSSERSDASQPGTAQPAARIDPTWVPGRSFPPKEPTPPDNGPSPAPDRSRTINIPPQTKNSSILDPDAAGALGSSAVVPSCVLTGQTLHNFALNDLNGTPWEYRTQRHGRLVLLDFWHSQCYPCLDAIRHLNIWQQSYGPYGLDVIGIAYEEGTPTERMQKVNRVRQRLGINYRLLQGGERDCPVRTQFGVLAYPTLVLLDDQGRIIWRSEGLGPDQMREVEIIIKQRLGVN